MTTTSLTTEQKKVDIFRRSYAISATLDWRHGRWFRGAIGRLMDQPEFHHHVGRGTIYSQPLIRYDTSNGSPVISGLGNGAYLLRAMPTINQLRIGNEEYVVLGQSDRAERLEIGPTSNTILYELSSPYLALNQENYRLWMSASARERDELLGRIIVGNILSFSKAIGLSLRDRIVAEPSLEPNGHFTLKPGVKLFGFRGSFRVNFQLPSGWGLGKSSSRGFGTIIRGAIDGHDKE